MPQILTSVSSVSVPAGGTATFQVKLGARPSGTKTVTVSRTSGDTDVTVSSGASLTFTKSNYGVYQTVTLAASATNANSSTSANIRCSTSDYDSANVTATQGAAAATPAIVTSVSAVNVPEGGNASFQVKLSAQPASSTTVTCARVSGDADLTVQLGSSLIFSTSNWNTYQSVTLASAADADALAGTATFRLTATGLAAKDVTATEVEAPVGTVISIDPVSRIEGHLAVKVTVENGVVVDAWSQATLFRGIETILQGRDPHDAPLITQRLCGVCTYIHQLCSTRAIENTYGAAIPDNARIVRNLLNGALYLHDHIVHFYNLTGLDWIDIVSALSADPAVTQALAQQISPSAPAIDFAAVKTRLSTFVNSGQLGPFANAYWGHSAYQLTPTENLLFAAHYLSALSAQVQAAKMQAVLGGKNPHPQSVVCGGVTCGSELNAARLTTFRSFLDATKNFVDTVYLPDLKYIASKYLSWASIGGNPNFMSYGEFPETAVEPSGLYFPRGYIAGGDIMNVQPLDVTRITEHVARSMYQGSTDLPPASGVTTPQLNTAFDLDAKYSWSKAPRYNGMPMEVGPLARVLVAYGLGHAEVRTAVDSLLSQLGATLPAMNSTLGRTAARAVETQLIAARMYNWLNQLQANLNAGSNVIFQNYAKPTVSKSGFGLNEAPRGGLGHWMNVSPTTISKYQMIVPSTWNLGPRDLAGNRGPLENALLGTPVADATKPVEVLRVIHSFDPCMACAVHLIEAETGESREFKIL